MASLSKSPSSPPVSSSSSSSPQNRRNKEEEDSNNNNNRNDEEHLKRRKELESVGCQMKERPHYNPAERNTPKQEVKLILEGGGASQTISFLCESSLTCEEAFHNHMKAHPYFQQNPQSVESKAVNTHPFLSFKKLRVLQHVEKYRFANEETIDMPLLNFPDPLLLHVYWTCGKCLEVKSELSDCFLSDAQTRHCEEHSDNSKSNNNNVHLLPPPHDQQQEEEGLMVPDKKGKRSSSLVTSSSEDALQQQVGPQPHHDMTSSSRGLRTSNSSSDNNFDLVSSIASYAPSPSSRLHSQHHPSSSYPSTYYVKQEVVSVVRGGDFSLTPLSPNEFGGDLLHTTPKSPSPYYTHDPRSFHSAPPPQTSSHLRFSPSFSFSPLTSSPLSSQHHQREVVTTTLMTADNRPLREDPVFQRFIAALLEDQRRKKKQLLLP